MIRIHGQRTVARSLEETFDYLADFSTTAEWDPAVTEAEVVGDGPIGEGSQFSLLWTFAGQKLRLLYDMKEYDRPNRIVLETATGRFRGVDTILFRSAGDHATVVDYTAEFTFEGPARFIAPLFQPVANRIGRKALDGIEQALGKAEGAPSL